MGFSEAELVGRIIGAAACVLMSAFFAGLTLGLMGLDTNELKLLIACGTAAEKAQAAIILPIRKHGNLLLCTLVYGNVAATALTSILLADLTDGVTGFIVSTFILVIFGEICPQAYCNRSGLYIGAKIAPMIYFVGAVLLPVTYPIALALDFFQGEEAGMTFDRGKLRELVAMQVTNSGINQAEGAMIAATLHLGTVRATECMTPREEIFSVLSSAKLNHALMKEIFEKGFSRIPVMGGEDNKVCLGLLYAKDLVLVHPEQEHPCVGAGPPWRPFHSPLTPSPLFLLPPPHLTAAA